MPTSRARSVTVIVVVLAVISLSACSGSDDDASAPTSTTRAAATTTTALSGELPVEIPGGSTLAPVSLVDRVVSVPVSVFDEVGQGTATLPVALPGPLLATGGKPRVIWIGADYCPYCAAERWAVVAALGRFGEFRDLRAIRSAPTPETFPETASFSFHGAHYASRYLAFEAVETETTARRALDTPTEEQHTLIQKYDAPPYFDVGSGSAIPFIDFADTFAISGVQYDPQVLVGQDHDEIAAALRDPSDPIAQGVIGTANTITAAICATTLDQPSTVCDDAVIRQLEQRLKTPTR